MFDHVRAILVALHIVAVLILAFPAPVGGMNKKTFAHPNTRAVFAEWTAAINAVGGSLTVDEFSAWAWVWGNRLVDTRREILGPANGYAKVTGVRQGWRMFGYLNRQPGRLEVILDEGDSERPLYIARHPEHNWRSHQLDSERFRGFMSYFAWKQSKGQYKLLATWLACKAAVDFPEATGIRVQMAQLRLPPAEELRTLHAIPVTKRYWLVERRLDRCP